MPSDGAGDAGAGPVLVASHRRSGTHLAIDALRNNLAPLSGPWENLDRLRPDSRRPVDAATMAGATARGPMVLKSHTHARFEDFFRGAGPETRLALDLLAGARKICVVRDGRDVMVSLYHYSRRFDPAVRAQPFGAFLRDRNPFNDDSYEGEMDRPSYWAFHVRSWLEAEDALVVRFEALRHDYARALERMAAHLGEPAPEDPVDARRRPGGGPIGWIRRRLPARWGGPDEAERTSVAFRRGLTGEWRSRFDEEDAAWFRERAGDALAALGYDP